MTDDRHDIPDDPEPRDLISHYELEIRRMRDMYDRNAADLARRQTDAALAPAEPGPT